VEQTDRQAVPAHAEQEAMGPGAERRRHSVEEAANHASGLWSDGEAHSL